MLLLIFLILVCFRLLWRIDRKVEEERSCLLFQQVQIAVIFWDLDQLEAVVLRSDARLGPATSGRRKLAMSQINIACGLIHVKRLRLLTRGEYVLVQLL